MKEEEEDTKSGIMHILQCKNSLKIDLIVSAISPWIFPWNEKEKMGTSSKQKFSHFLTLFWIAAAESIFGGAQSDGFQIGTFFTLKQLCLVVNVKIDGKRIVQIINQGCFVYLEAKTSPNFLSTSGIIFQPNNLFFS